MLDPAPGVLLIADPFLKDPNFLRTVVFLCEHKEEGSFGLTLNRLSESTLDELIPELEMIGITCLPTDDEAADYIYMEQLERDLLNMEGEE